METYLKIPKEARRKLIQDEAQKYRAMLIEALPDLSNFFETVCSLVTAKPILSANLSLLIIQNKALFAALSQFEQFPAVLAGFDTPKYRQLFLLSAENFVPPDSEAKDVTKYWVIVLLWNVHLIAQIGKCIRLTKNVELSKKFVYTFKPVLSKNIGIADFSNKIKLIPLGKDFPELVYLIRTLVYLLVKEQSLLSASMDISTVPSHFSPKKTIGFTKHSREDTVWIRG